MLSASGTSLTSLSLRTFSITGQDLWTVIQGFPHLESLTLGGCALHRKGGGEVTLQNLTMLDVSDYHSMLGTLQITLEGADLVQLERGITFNLPSLQHLKSFWILSTDGPLCGPSLDLAHLWPICGPPGWCRTLSHTN
jgi:hypothetical protein